VNQAKYIGMDVHQATISVAFSATGRRRSFFVDIPFYRTTYLKVRHRLSGTPTATYRS
jgi:hypothetical protein